jgi:hypothetical protein
MEKIIINLVLIALLAGTISTSFGQEPDRKSVQAREDLQKAQKDVIEAKKDIIEAQKDSIIEYQKFKKESEERIMANDMCIAELTTKMANCKKGDLDKYQKDLAKLEQKNIDLKKKLNDYKLDDQFDWLSFKIEFNHDMEGLDKALKDFSISNLK